jgi:hypothetical protein
MVEQQSMTESRGFRRIPGELPGEQLADYR